MSGDDARKRAEELVREEWRGDLPIDAMLRFADERLEEAARAVAGEPWVVPLGDRLVHSKIIRSFKSTPPAPPETREERYRRALQKFVDAMDGFDDADSELELALREAQRALEEHAPTPGANPVKDDKQRPASERQRRQAVRLGVKLEEGDTVHSACQKLNAAAQSEALAKKKHGSTPEPNPS